MLDNIFPGTDIDALVTPEPFAGVFNPRAPDSCIISVSGLWEDGPDDTDGRDSSIEWNQL